MRGHKNRYGHLGLAVAAAIGVHLAFILLVLLDTPRVPPDRPAIKLALVTPYVRSPTQAHSGRSSSPVAAPYAHLSAPTSPQSSRASPVAASPTAVSSATPRVSSNAVAALQFGQACQQARKEGKPLPKDCATSAAAAPLGPRPVTEFAAAAQAINAHRAYQAAPGSPDFWGRAHTSGSPSDRGDGLEKYGLYTGDPVKQRVFGQCAGTSSCTQDGHDPRGPDYHPGFVTWTDPKDQK